jgi:long-chain acyl-CoA synthetase
MALMSTFGFDLFATRNADAVAAIDPRGRAWTRGELAALMNRLANVFVSHDLAVGDTVAIVAPNCAEYLAAVLAGIAAGLYVVPINWHLAEREIDYLIENSRARAVVTHSRIGAARLAALAARARRLPLAVSIDAAPDFEPLRSLTAGMSDAPPARPMGRLLPYTSATTGVPKAVKRPLASARSSLERFVAWHASLGVTLESDNVHLACSMLYHSAPLDGARVALEMGHAVVLLERWEPELLLRTIAEQRVTTAFMVPTMFARLLQLPDSVRAVFSTASLRFVVHGGAPCAHDVKRRMLDWWGPVVFEAYGAAEAQGTIVSAAEWLRYPGTVGRPAPGASVKILGADARELPTNEIGAVYLKPYTGDSFEYLGDAAKTRAAHVGEYVTVGDRGYVNDEGYLFLVGRESDLILSSGMNIYPAEIEQALMAHPAVADCAVVATPHALCGQVPEAYVELAEGVAPCAELTRALLALLADRLSPMKLPRRVVYVRSLPRDPAGKLARHRIRTEGVSDAG